jgi:hypothetical protein
MAIGSQSTLVVTMHAYCICVLTYTYMGHRGVGGVYTPAPLISRKCFNKTAIKVDFDIPH